MIKSCYIHIPFCENICSYCDFCKLLYNEKIIDKYLDCLEKEIEEKYKKEKLETIYIGGGTPSCLSINQLERLFEILSRLNKDENIEYTIEGNFSSTTKEKLLLYKKYGINRLSLGIESIDKDNLKFLERKLDTKDVKRKILLMKKLGFNNINVDIIYAIPNESLEILEKDIDFILSLNVEHISTYSLIIEENTKLFINREKNIDEELDFKMYNLITRKLKKKNYIHYEISNFCKKGYESKHNNCYWLNKKYYGFGLGASSYISNKRITNTRSLSKYLQNDYVSEIEELSNDDKIEYEIILNLRLLNGIDLNRFYSRYNYNLLDAFDCNDLIKNNFLQLYKNFLRIPEDKIYLSNEIIVKLLQNKK